MRGLIALCRNCISKRTINANAQRVGGYAWLRDWFVRIINFDERDLSAHKQRCCVLECPCSARFRLFSCPSPLAPTGARYVPASRKMAECAAVLWYPNVNPLLSSRDKHVSTPVATKLDELVYTTQLKKPVPQHSLTALSIMLSNDGETRSLDQLH